MVTEKLSSDSVAISGAARYQSVAAGTNSPKANNAIQHAMCSSGPTFAGCSSLSTRRLKGTWWADAAGVVVPGTPGTVETVVMG
ncbi:hypothetical protein LRC484719_38010 [Mycobacterium riyadhense]